MIGRLDQVLGERAIERFVGRTAELSQLAALLRVGGPLVAHVHGIGGVGKSTLLDAFARQARQRRAVVVSLDCRAVEPTERGVVHALADRLGSAAATAQQLTAQLRTRGRRVVLIFDNYEVFRLVDTWLRQVFVPALPATVRLVLASRVPPVPAWLTAPAWAGLFCDVPLGPLSDVEAGELLGDEGLTGEPARRVNQFARGHPLALKLAAWTLSRQPGMVLEGAAVHSVIDELTRRYLSDIDDPQTLAALNAASLVRSTTQSLLRAMLGTADAPAAFDKLAALPFVESHRDGLIVHEAVRTAIAAHLRAVDPLRYRTYRRAAWRQLRAEVRSAGLADLWRYTADLLYSVENPVIREAFFPSNAQPFVIEPANRDDGPAIAAVIDRHEPAAAATELHAWWKALPGAFHVARDRSATACGFYCMFEPGMSRWTPVDDDPITRQWRAHLRADPVPRDQRVLFLRRWLGAADGERPSALQAACFLDIKRTYLELRPQLRRVYLTICDLATWTPAFEQLGFRVLGTHQSNLGGVCYHSAMLDFGPASVDGWLATLIGQELGIDDAGGVLDLKARALNVDGRRVPLTRLEFEVLHYLVQHPGEAVSRTALRHDVWGHRGESSSNVVEAIIRVVRRKLGGRADLIETVSGVGYRFRA